MRRPAPGELSASASTRTGWPWAEGSPRLPDTMPDGRPWPRISIVTPSFNQAEYLEETIRSVLLQGYPNLEYIIIDGGSNDGSVDIIREYEPWLAYWVSEPDGGQSDAINKGWRRSQGDIIAWINSDDSYCPGALAAAVDHLANNPSVDLVYGSCNCIGPQGQHLGVLKAWPFDLKRQMTGRNLVLQSSSFFRRSALDITGELNVDLHYLMDYDLWVRMIQHGFTIEDIPVVQSNYRLHSAAKTIAHRAQMISEMKLIFDNIYSDTSWPLARKWSGSAYSTYHRSMGEVYYHAGQMAKARREFWQAIRCQPFRLTVVVVLAYWVDTFLDTRLGPAMQRLRWRLPDVPKGDVQLGEGATRPYW